MFYIAFIDIKNIFAKIEVEEIIVSNAYFKNMFEKIKQNGYKSFLVYENKIYNVISYYNNNYLISYYGNMSNVIDKYMIVYKKEMEFKYKNKFSKLMFEKFDIGILSKLEFFKDNNPELLI